MRSAIVVCLLLVTCAAGAEEPRRLREWPATRSERLALAELDREARELVRLRGELAAREKEHAAALDEVVAEIASRLGVARSTRLRYDDARGAFVEVAPIATAGR